MVTRTVGLATAMLLILSVLVGGASASSGTARAGNDPILTHTKVKVQDPFTADGQLRSNLWVGDHLLGFCWEGSIVTGQKNAWRCKSGNAIHDPCFKHSGVRDLICMNAPWSKAVQRLRLTRRLPGDGNSGVVIDDQPWGYKLLNGTRCVLGGGTANWVGNVPLPYACSRHRSGSTANRNRPFWRVKIAPRSLDRLRVRRVAKAWF